MYRLIAIDLDDTLLNKHGLISETNRQAIINAEKRGIRVSIVSGRSYASSQQFIKALNLKSLSVSLNGAYIHDPQSGEIVSSVTIDSQVMQTLLRELGPFEVHTNYYTGSTVLCEVNGEYADFYRKINNIEIEFVDSLLEYSQQAEAGKLLLIGDHEKLARIRDHLLVEFGSDLNIVFSKPIFLEIFPKTTSKGTALLKIAETYGIKPAEILAIGDGENDISMFHQAGMSVAMGNASLAVQREATFVTHDLEADGVAFAIERFVLNE